MIGVRPVTPADTREWERMREALWPSDPGEHAGEIEKFFSSELHEPLAVLLAFDDSGNALRRGSGGKPLNMPIEVRQVMSGPPE